jgi:hypothetical protein
MYCTYIDLHASDNEDYESYRDFIRRVDNPDPKYGISADGWEPKFNDEGIKEHPRLGPKKKAFNQDHLDQYCR